MSKDSKNVDSIVGATIVYAFMQAIGMVRSYAELLQSQEIVIISNPCFVF
ncbi:MAG: DNA-3-methyladenine glycosylase I [Bdellovibrionota bacterium]